MIRRPNIGDLVFLVPSDGWGHYVPDESVECPISEVDAKHFYANGIAFEIESYFDGSWYNGGYVDDENIPFCEWDAFLSRDAYERQVQKESRIDEIGCVDLHGLSCEKIEAIYHLIFEKTTNDKN